MKFRPPLHTTARDSRPCRREACVVNVLDKPTGQSNEEMAVQVCASSLPCSFRNCLRHRRLNPAMPVGQQSKITFKAFLEASSASAGSNCPITLSWQNIASAHQGQVFRRVEPSFFQLFNDQLKIQMLIFARRRQGHGKGIRATVLVPITSLRTRNARHYLEEDETDHSSRRGVSV